MGVLGWDAHQCHHPVVPSMSVAASVVSGRRDDQRGSSGAACLGRAVWRGAVVGSCRLPPPVASAGARSARHGREADGARSGGGTRQGGSDPIDALAVAERTRAINRQAPA